MTGHKWKKKTDIEISAYIPFFEQIKHQIRESQLRAALSVNGELVKLYWSLGKSIIEKQEVEGWGTKVIERLAKDLGTEFPGMSGFSPRNLKYMRKFAEVYPDFQLVQAVLAQIPWWHNILLLEKLRSSEERMWYAHRE